MEEYCDRGADIVFGHNIMINDIIFNDYVFHVCGGQTWLNAKISVKTEKQVMCQEEFASIFRSVQRAKTVSMKAIDVSTWAEREVTAEGKTACIWQHAVDILDRKWVGL
jgi:peptide deformylase